MKKRISSFILAVTLVLSLTACGGKTGSSVPSGTTTLMIYMVGSDLESKAAAGTKDLEEMVQSGVDLSKVNVLVYAGGSPRWHNEQASAEAHTVLQLTENGFTQVATTAALSMGDSTCLANFLNFGCSNFPADHYGLILWNHGNGPVIGYGKDMLFDNDSLTLQEMADALAASPFNAENKLDFVGFDACLMSSAELCHIWKDYARYLVASQEVEPSFGWNYSFLSSIGTASIETVLSDMAQSYLSTCLAYYEERGYESRDTTLSCMDLSYADQLSAAVDALFARALSDVSTSYNQLTQRRVNTRALGRASTGSEYDLIDLQDLSVQMADLYPDESKALQSVIGEMVVQNATNADGCCGMSLYYPFFNKPYYEDSWDAVYSSLGLFPSYQQYLKSFAAQWLAESTLFQSAPLAAPSPTTKNTYTVTLTSEQNATFADARYIILDQWGHDCYAPIFYGSTVTNDHGVLTASFDGNVLYAKNNFNQYILPTMKEQDTVGSITRYSALVYLTNGKSMGSAEYVAQPHRFHLAVDNQSGNIHISALTPYDQQVDSGSLAGGKVEDVDLSQWYTYYFPRMKPQYLSRYENGLLKPVSAWPYSDIIIADSLPVLDGLEFVYAPLVQGDYFLTIEIEDTQGNRYCSELLPIHTDGQLEPPVLPENISVSWDEGEEVLIMDEDGITVALGIVQQYGSDIYTIAAANETDEDITVTISDLHINGNILCQEGYNTSFTIAAGEVNFSSGGLDFGDIIELPFPDPLQHMGFTMDIVQTNTKKTLLHHQSVDVMLSQDVGFIPTDSWASSCDFTTPILGFHAPEQVLSENENLRITLLGIGGDRNLCCGLKIENLSRQAQHLQMEGFVLDGVYIPCSSSTITVPVGFTYYLTSYLWDSDLTQYHISDIKDVTLCLRFPEDANILSFGGFSALQWIPVQADMRGSGSPFPTGNPVLYNENGIRISLLKYEQRMDSHYWYATVENNTDKDISIDLHNVMIDGQLDENTSYPAFFVHDSAVGAHQKTVCYFSPSSLDPIDLQNVEFSIRIMDFTREKILQESAARIYLAVPD